MAGYGLSRALQGAVQGMDATEARRDRATDREYTGLKRERETTQFDQSQQDRQFALGRRDIETERGDKEYQRLESNRMRKIAVNDAVKAWQMKGDLTGLNAVANEYTPEGVDIQITANKDGTYTMTSTGGGKTESEVLDENKLGSYAMMLNDDDFVASMQGQAEKEGDRAHDMAKIDRKGAWDAKVKGIGATGTGSAGSKEQRMLVSQGNKTLSEQYGGNFDGMTWFPDPANKDEGLVAKAILSGKIYSGTNDSNAAALQAVNEVKAVVAAAESQINEEIKAGTLKKDKSKERRSQLIRQFGNEAAGRYGTSIEEQEKGGPALGREAPAGDGKPETGGGATPEFVDWLKKNDTPENRKSFNGKFGDGEAEKALGDSKQSGGKSDVSLIKGANASDGKQEQPKEVPSLKPVSSRQTRAKEGKKSFKQHQSIALSEYESEWETMSSKEKLTWWTENSKALQAKSPRKHRKAQKEVREIRSKSDRGRNK